MTPSITPGNDRSPPAARPGHNEGSSHTKQHPQPSQLSEEGNRNMRPTIITVEDVERFRAHDRRSVILARHRQVTRDDAVSASLGEPVYLVDGETVRLSQTPGGYLADHDCTECAADRPCFRGLAAVDAEGTERWIAECDAVWHATKVEAAR